MTSMMRLLRRWHYYFSSFLFKVSSSHSNLMETLEDFALVVEVCTLSTTLYLHAVVFEPE
jgi:hypothetical protein